MSTLTRQFRAAPWIGLALGVITLSLYLPMWRHEFLAYDDQHYVTENRMVQDGLTAKGVVWAFGFHAGNWHPLAWISHMLDCQLFGLNPGGHHLTNALLHTASTVLLFAFLLRVTGAPWRSAAVAALFGWHPLHVESVAWVAERKDVLCAGFWMLTLLAYARYAQASGARMPRSRLWYGLTLLLFVLALMSKPMAVTLPCVLLLLDFWPLQRVAGVKGQKADEGPQRHALSWLAAEKIPFLALSAGACALTVAAQQSAIVSTAGLSISQRLTHALVSYAHYLGAMFWPRELAVYYPYEVNLPSGTIILSATVLVAITVGAVWTRKRRPWVAVGWFWFLGTLVPVIGLVQVGDQAWADRYTYLPLIGLFIAVVWLVAEIMPNRKLAGALALVVAIAMMATTSRQLRHWQNTRSLFAHAEQVTKNNHMAITMLGSLLAKEGKLDEAIEKYRAALRLRPGYPEAHFFLGNAYDQQGNLEAAAAEYEQALWYAPLKGPAHILLGVALAKLNRPEDAAAHYAAALQLDATSAVAHNNLARLRHTQGRLDEAIEHYTAAAKLDPMLAQAHNNLGIVLLQRGRVAEGTVELRAALRLNPTNSESQFNLALALNQQGQWTEAAELFRQTVGTALHDANAHSQFALALARLGQTREAMAHFATALLAQPDFAAALDGLAWILATDERAEYRNGEEAVRMATRACELTARKDPVKLKTLAATYAETGRFADAMTVIENARELAAAAGREALTAECRQMRENFAAGKPWRTPAMPTK